MPVLSIDKRSERSAVRFSARDFLLVDNDRVEKSNFSRIVGATRSDALNRTAKVDIGRRVFLQANPSASDVTIDDDAAKESVAQILTDCNYLFLAADSMCARLVVNAIVHQYLIPGDQMGSKIRSDSNGKLLEVLSVNRPLRPGTGCLW